MATDNIGPRIELDGEKEFKKSLSSVDAQIKALGAETKALTAEFAANATSEEALSAKNEVLGRSAQAVQTKMQLLDGQISRQKELLSQLSAELDRVIQAQGENSKEASKAQNAYNDQAAVVARLETQYQSARAQLAGFKNEMAGVEDASGQAGQSLASGGAALTMGNFLMSAGVITGLKKIADGLKECVDASMEFETAMKSFNKVAKLSDEELSVMAGAIRQMAQEIPATTSEIAQVAEASARLGVDKENILEFTRVMIDLGNVSDLSSEAAATALARFANIAGTASENYARLGSVIVALGNNFATSESEITAMASRLASAGTLAGLTEAQIMGLAAAMSSVGIEAEAGGTAMTQTLTAMEKAVTSGGSALERFAEISGMSTQAFTQAWQREPIEAISAFITGLGQLDERGESATLVLDELGLSGVRQSNMLKSLALANETLTAALETANQAWIDNTELSNTAAEAYDTTEAKAKMVANSFNELKISIGETLKPVTDALLDFADFALKALNSSTEQEAGFFARAFGKLPGAAEAAADAMENAAEAAEDTGKGMEDAADGTDTASKSFSELAEVSEESKAAVEALTGAADTLTDALKEQKDAGTLSLDTANQLIEAGYASAIAIDEETGAVTLNRDEYIRLTKAKISDQMASLETQKQAAEEKKAQELTALAVDGLSKSYINMQRQKILAEYANDTTALNAHIAALKQAMSALDSYGTSSGKAARRSGAAAKKVKTQAEQDLASYKAMKAELDHEKAMELVSEAEYYNRLTALRNQYLTDAANVEEYRKVSESIYKADQEAMEKRRKLWEDTGSNILKLEEDFQNRLSVRASDIVNSYKLFEAVPEYQVTAGETLMANLEGQISAIESFYTNLTELQSRGVSEALVAEIRSMGVSASGELQGLLDMTDDQLTQYSEKFGEKQALANQIAEEELKDLRSQTNEAIMGQLGDVAKLYETNAPDLGKQFAQELAAGMFEGMPAVEAMAQTVANAAMSAFAATYNRDVEALMAEPRQSITTGDIGELLAGAVNGINAGAAGMGGDLHVTVDVNGRALAETTLEDFRTVGKERPETLDDQ